MLASIVTWIKSNLAISIIIGAVVVGGAVATPIILLNQGSDPKPKEETVVDQGDKDNTPNCKTNIVLDENNEYIADMSQVCSEDLNEDGCPNGFHINYYGLCQDNNAYKSQECPNGYVWRPNALIGKNVLRELTFEEYKAGYGVDGLAKGFCFAAQDHEWNGVGRPYLDEYYSKCGRGYTYHPDDGCYDSRKDIRHSSVNGFAGYEERVLNKLSAEERTKIDKRSELTDRQKEIIEERELFGKNPNYVWGSEYKSN